MVIIGAAGAVAIAIIGIVAWRVSLGNETTESVKPVNQPQKLLSQP
jgi:hypothetical protein